MESNRKCGQPSETLPKVIIRLEFSLRDGTTGMMELTLPRQGNFRGTHAHRIISDAFITLRKLESMDGVCFFSDNKTTI